MAQSPTSYRCYSWFSPPTSYSWFSPPTSYSWWHYSTKKPPTSCVFSQGKKRVEIGSSDQYIKCVLDPGHVHCDNTASQVVVGGWAGEMVNWMVNLMVNYVGELWWLNKTLGHTHTHAHTFVKWIHGVFLSFSQTLSYKNAELYHIMTYNDYINKDRIPIPWHFPRFSFRY